MPVLKNLSDLKCDLQDSEYMPKMADKFLELLIYLICERFDPFISKCLPGENLQREVLHYLCIEPMSYSEISVKIYREGVILFRIK